jgi:SSS family solute:Na+ symporter
MAAFTLIIVGKYFTHFLSKGYLYYSWICEKRFSTNLKTILAVFGLPYMFCKSYTVLYLGGLAIETMVCMMYAIGLALLQQLIHCMADYLLWLGLMLFR